MPWPITRPAASHPGAPACTTSSSRPDLTWWGRPSAKVEYKYSGPEPRAGVHNPLMVSRAQVAVLISAFLWMALCLWLTRLFILSAAACTNIGCENGVALTVAFAMIVQVINAICVVVWHRSWAALVLCGFGVPLLVLLVLTGIGSSL
jgi:hypothetical protein